MRNYKKGDESNDEIKENNFMNKFEKDENGAFLRLIIIGSTRPNLFRLFEKKENAPMPDWLREDYEKKINKSVKHSSDGRFTG